MAELTEAIINVERLSEEGMSPISPADYVFHNDAVLTLLAHRVANIVQRSNQTILEGVVASLWAREGMEGIVFALIPCSQTMRLAIALTLASPPITRSKAIN